VNKAIPATDLREGMILALPMGRTATVRGTPRVGRQFVSFITEYGATRVEIRDEVLIETNDVAE